MARPSQSTFSKCRSPWTMWLVSNGSRTPWVSSTISRRLTTRRGSTWGMSSRPWRAGRSGPTVPYSRLASSWGAASISGRSSGAAHAVEVPQQHGELADGAASLAGRHGRPPAAEHLPGAPAHDQPVGAELAAVGHDLGVVDLGRQQRAEEGLAPQALVGPPVHPDHVLVGEPDLVGDAARPLERDGVVEPGLGQGPPGTRLGPLVRHRGRSGQRVRRAGRGARADISRPVVGIERVGLDHRCSVVSAYPALRRC